MVNKPTPLETGSIDGEGGTDQKSDSKVIAAIIAVWCLLVVGSFTLGDSVTPRFLDIPISAFLAGQGALVGLVLVGIRVAKPDLDDRR